MGFFFTSNASAQSYDQLWKQIESLKDDDKPKSMIELAEKVYEMARKEDNFPQLMKAKICIVEKQCDLDPELFAGDEYEKMITELEGNTTISAEERCARLALSHCMLASAYNSMHDTNVHDFDQETREQFPAKAKEHMIASLADMETLSKVNCKQYEPLLKTYADGEMLNHDLLYPLVVSALRYSFAPFSEDEKLDIIGRAIKVYQKNGNKNGEAIFRLRELEMRKQSRIKANMISKAEWRKEMKALLDVCVDEEYGIDVAIDYAEDYSNDKDERLAFVRWAQEKWKGNVRVNAFKNMEASIMATNITMKGEENMLAGKPFTLNLSYVNATEATLTIREYAGETSDRKLSEKGKVVLQRRYDLPLDEDNQKRKLSNLPTSGTATDELTLSAGHYTMVAEANGTKSVYEVSVRSIRAVSIAQPDQESVKIVVLDNATGRPVPGASVLLFDTWDRKHGKKPSKTFKCNEKGEVLIAKYKDMEVRYAMAVRDVSDYGTPKEDCTSTFNPRYNYTSYTKYDSKTINAYTDRSIYRPGQKLHAACVEFWQHADTVKVIAGSSVYVTINDPNGKQLYKEYVKTNEFGSLSVDFQIPDECKLGRYYINFRDGVANGSCAFNVEEYKRPTFEVLYDDSQKDVKHKLGDKIEVKGSAMMFTGVPNQGANVEYTIEWASASRWRYILDWKPLDGGETTTGDDGVFVVDVNAELPEIVYSDSVAFRIKANVTDAAGEMQSGEFVFNVKNPDYKEIKEPEQEDENAPKDELHFSNNEISENQPVQVTFKAKEKDVLVYYYIMSRNSMEQEGTKVLNGDELKLDIKYRKEWGDGVSVNLFYVHNGRLYSDGRELPYVRPEKKLDLKWKTFRDNLQPGQKEEWVLSVKDHKGRVVPGAEVMAVMYDASLDNIIHHDWQFSLRFARKIPFADFAKTDANSDLYLNIYPGSKYLNYPSRSFDKLESFQHQRWYRMPIYPEPRPMVRMEAMMAKANMDGEREVDESLDDEEEQNEGTQQVRSNLDELAFFYPHLVTDENGEAQIAFTLPDCLTEWKFMGIVHSKQVDYGKIVATATAKRDFMIQPNMPRFLRTGDKGEINAKITNLCENAVNGTATMRILRADNEEEVMKKTVSFNAEAGKSTTVTFAVEGTLDCNDYICEIVATDGKASDGERNRLPVLTTKVDVVESVPFYLDGASTKDVDLSAIFNGGSATVTDKHISIGYTDNPALSVFESLKALQNPKHDNAPCYAAALYSNLVMLDMSKVLGDRLKDFDAAKAQRTADKAIEKLQKLQKGSGGWSWFEGMEESFYITLSVAENLHRLQSYLNRHEEKCPKEVSKMLKSALKYLDKEEYRIFKIRKKDVHDSLRPYDTDLRYLAICTNPNKEMLDTYLKRFEGDFKNLTIYGRSEGVLILKKYGHEKQALRFLDSVKEYTMYKEGFGRYFATDLAYYSWMDYRIPTQLAAMRGITAFESKKPKENRQYLIDMQLWLLRQKQTQVWDNPINALDVADFLLTNSPEVSLHEVTTPELKLDGVDVKQDTVYDDVKEVKTLSVTKTSPGISWGHVRSEFKEEVSNLNAYSSGELTIERKVIRDGNKVTIRHIIHADRDMDFVSVMSQHAACLEPLRAVSGYQWMGGRGCYLEVHDSCINLFFNRFTRGTTTIDMDYYIARGGEYNTGYASVECSYAPEFGAHTAGNVIDCNK